MDHTGVQDVKLRRRLAGMVRSRSMTLPDDLFCEDVEYLANAQNSHRSVAGKHSKRLSAVSAM